MYIISVVFYLLIKEVEQSAPSMAMMAVYTWGKSAEDRHADRDLGGSGWCVAD
jgi:hypothetical protein